MSKYLFALIALAAVFGQALSATYAQPSGYGHGIASLPLGGTSSLVWDVAGGQAVGECYLWNDNDFRRITPATGTVSASGLFGGLPAGQNSFDYAAIDPLNPNVVYASFSTWTPAASSLYVFTRTGSDAATAGISQSYASYTAINTTATGTEHIAIYRLRFMPNLPSVPVSLRGKLIAFGGDTTAGLGMGPTKIWAVNTNAASPDYLKLTELATIADPSAGPNSTIDADGNIYVVNGYQLPNDIVLRYNAADLVNALAGTVSPLTASNAVEVVSAGDMLGDLGSIAVRDEEGHKYLYFSQSNTGSIYRRNLTTEEIRLWAKGFGPIDNFNYWGGTSAIEFENLSDNFKPFGGGSSRMVTTFTIGATNTLPYQWGSITAQFHVFTPSAVNVAVANLNVTQAPYSIGKGVPFQVTLEALNSTGGAITSDVAVEVSLATGSGTLGGFLVQVGTGSALNISMLEYDNTLTVNESISITFTIVGTAVSQTVALTVISVSNGGGSGTTTNSDESSSGCASAGDTGWPLTGLLLFMFGYAAIRRQRQTAKAS